MKAAITKRLTLATAATTMLLLVGQAAPINSQVIYNTGGDAMLNTMMTNTMNQITVNDLTDPGIVTAMKAQRAAGAAKIAAGKATTNFTSSLEGTRALAGSLSWESWAPQDLPGQTEYIKRYVKQFNTLMTNNGYKPNDYVDGLAFAIALSYAAYNDKNPNDAEIQKFRKDERAAILKDQSFQGVDDARKQYLYERNALMAMQAAEFRAKARRAASDKDRQYWEEKAKHYGGFLLTK